MKPSLVNIKPRNSSLPNLNFWSQPLNKFLLTMISYVISHYVMTKIQNEGIPWFDSCFIRVMLGCTGSCYVCTTLQARYHCPNLCMQIEWLAYHFCQIDKNTGHRCVMLGTDIAGTPQESIAFDLIGLWSASMTHGSIEFHSLTYTWQILLH